jgi:predicted DNA-binding transcriptional regulator AlpA
MSILTNLTDSGSATTESSDESGVYTAQQLADFLQISLRLVWQMRDAGVLPAPIKLGRLTRWSKTSIEAWLAR